jgi:hypothetical protein
MIHVLKKGGLINKTGFFIIPGRLLAADYNQ